MIRGFYTARSGLIAHQEHINTIANNMANVNTNGFKPMKTAFKDLIYQNINRPQAENPANVGHGVKINKNDIMMLQGPLAPTGMPLDFALVEENAFFAVETAAGEIFYTRAGNFSLSNSDETYFLINGNGDRVLDIDGAPIEIVFDEFGNFEISPELLGVFRFSNPFGLWSIEGKNFAETPESGVPELIENPQIKPGYLENSAVEVANEMAKLIEASKAFSFSARMLQTTDEIEQTVNALR